MQTELMGFFLTLAICWFNQATTVRIFSALCKNSGILWEGNNAKSPFPPCFSNNWVRHLKSEEFYHKLLFLADSHVLLPARSSCLVFFLLYLCYADDAIVIKWENTGKNWVGWVGNGVSAPQCQAGLSELLDQVIPWPSRLKLPTIPTLAVIPTMSSSRDGCSGENQRKICSRNISRVHIVGTGLISVPQTQKASLQLCILSPGSFLWSKRNLD